MERVSPPDGVTFHTGAVGSISGLWCKPTYARSGDTILHLKRRLVQLGIGAGVPESGGPHRRKDRSRGVRARLQARPRTSLPAAGNDVLACYRGLVECMSSGGAIPVGAVVLSPVTDLTLTGPSFETRSEADPYFVRPQVEGLVRSYLGDTDPKNPLASPLYGNLAGLPPISIHVGDDEVLLDDSRRYFERAVAAGVNARLDVWEGMPHGFAGSVGKLAAAAKALDAVGEFLAQRLKRSARV